MHAPPAFEMTLSCFGWSRAAAVVLAAAITGVTGVWAMQAMESSPWTGGTLFAWAVIASTCLMNQALKWHPLRLRWDMQRWHLQSENDALNDSCAGQMKVAMDIGPWMLLEFVEEGQERSFLTLRRSTWLPLQRHGHEPAWHALRCAAYADSPRSPDAADPE